MDGTLSTPPPPSVEPVPVPPGRATPAVRKVGQYELLLELASGGMAVVHLGRAQDGRAAAPLVAIKMPHRHLATDKNFLAMLLDEARLASSITHPNVVKVRELSFHDGEPFIVMDYVEGASLSELLKELTSRQRAFDLAIALRIVLDALAGLHAAHELCDASGKPIGIVHRDISPHNVLVGSDGRTRLADFGIAHATDRFQETRTQEVKGKLAYLAPERVDRRRICTRQSDVFSMAIVLWECLAGRRLFRGDQAVDTLQEVMQAPIPRLRQLGRDIPPALDAVIARALSRDLEERHATALEFATALETTAGPSAIAPPALVARVIETLYGARIADRHDQVSKLLQDETAAERLFVEAGLPPRTSRSTPPSGATLEALRAFAPPAPSQRYAFGQGQPDFRQAEVRRTRWAVVAGVATGLTLGAGGALLFAARRPPPGTAAAHASAEPPGPPPAPWTAAPPTAESGRPAAPTRHVVIPLPFVASRVILDGVAHDLSPAADLLSLDVPLAAGTRHHVVAMALDGSRAQADVTETGGVGHATGSGFSLLPLDARSSGADPSTAAAPRGAGVVRNGFTRLR